MKTRAIKAGINEFLAQPIDIVALSNCLHNSQKPIYSILAVDYDEFYIEAHRQVLQLLGYKVQVATNAVAVLEDMKFGSIKCDIIIIEYDMPQINGIDFAKAVREISAQKKQNLPPIIVVSYDENPFFRRQCHDAGVYEILMKPVSKRVLNETIEAAIHDSNL